MNLIPQYLVVMLFSYLVGSINPAYIMARLRNCDIHQKGSGNPGASNALILFGKLRGVLCAVIDIGKTVLVISLMRHMFSGLRLVYPVAAASCVLGHIFPFYMKFKGGKGLACLTGVVLCYDWRFFLVALTVEVVIALMTDYICSIPLTAAVIFPVCYVALERELWGALTLAVASVVICYRHLENLRRIRQGTELRLSYLWKKEQEIERMKENTGKTEEDYLIDFHK